jgi:hypothetical protein
VYCSELDDQGTDDGNDDDECNGASNEASDEEMLSQEDSASENTSDEDDEECQGEIEDLLDEALTDERSAGDQKEVVTQPPDAVENTVLYIAIVGRMILSASFCRSLTLDSTLYEN